MTTTGAGLEGVVAGESEICFIDGDEGILSYRGYNIHTLADNATFEEVIFLLWNGRLPKQRRTGTAEDGPGGPSARFRNRWWIFWARCPKARPMDVLRTAVSMLSSVRCRRRRTCRRRPTRCKAVRLMAQTATIVTTFDRLRNGKPVVEGDPKLGFAANFLYTLTGKRPDDVMERAFDVALILHADHELNASTFAARVTAATLSDIYSVDHVGHRRAERARCTAAPTRT